jgi:hypothetical protein
LSIEYFALSGFVPNFGGFAQQICEAVLRKVIIWRRPMGMNVANSQRRMAIHANVFNFSI